MCATKSTCNFVQVNDHLCVTLEAVAGLLPVCPSYSVISGKLFYSVQNWTARWSGDVTGQMNLLGNMKTTVALSALRRDVGSPSPGLSI